jgi:D-alanyl-lipoteichoic acid acyltransferase DltB (MBOAT superfamily)
VGWHTRAMTDSTTAPQPKALSVASLITGVVAGATVLLPIVGVLLGAAAVVLGVVAIRKQQSKVLAAIGIVLGAIALVVSLFFTIAWIGLGAATGTA